MDDIKEPSHCAKSKEPFLPPFLGGPIDEIFLRDATLRRPRSPLPLLTSPVQGRPRNRPVHRKPKVAINVRERMIRNATRLALAPEQLLPPGPSGDEVAERYRPLLELLGVWVCVSDIPAYLFHLVYHFFSQLGTLATMRAYDEQSFFLLYKSPRNTLRALAFHRKRLVFLDQVVFLSCNIIKPFDMELINSDHTPVSTASDDAIDPKLIRKFCKEIFVYEDEYVREFVEQLDADSVNGTDEDDEDDKDEDMDEDTDGDEDEDYYDVSENEYIEPIEFINPTLLCPTESQMNQLLLRSREWLKMHFVAFRTYIASQYEDSVSYILYCLKP